MKSLFEMLLRLYPAGPRELLGPEMVRVFEQGASEHRQRGRFAFACFAVRELFGLLSGCASAWRLSEPGEPALDLRKMRPPEVSKARYVTALDEVLAARRLVLANLRRMQDSISHREFEKARFYSDEERKAREQLRVLHRKYRIAESGG